MRRNTLWPRLAVLSLLAIAAAGPATGTDWPGWRGPDQDGKVEAPGTFTEDFALQVRWKRPLGRGYSSLSVVDGKAVTLFGDGENDHLVALAAADGKELWRLTLGPTYRGHHGSEDGPIGTPTIAGGVVYALGPRGRLVAARLADGELLWSRDLVEELGARAPFYGFSTSPLVAGDLLLVQTGGAGGRAVSGLDRRTGELRWQAGEDSASHQLPLLLDPGKLQMLAVTDTRLSGIEPRTGRVLWTHQHSSKPQYVPTYPQPVRVGEDHLLLVFEKHAELLEMVVLEDEILFGELWRTTHLKGSEAVPIVDRDHLYGFDGAFLTCVDRRSGRQVWKSRPPGGRGLIWVDGHLLVFAPDGDLVVIAATPEGYRERGRVKVAENGGLTPPSFADGVVFVRNQSIVAAIAVESGPDQGRAAAEAGD